MFCVASYLTNNLSLRVLEFADVDLHTIPILLRKPQCGRCFFGCVRGAALLHSCGFCIHEEALSRGVSGEIEEEYFSFLFWIRQYSTSMDAFVNLCQCTVIIIHVNATILIWAMKRR